MAGYLEEEESLGDLLDQLLGHILGEELSSEFKLQRVLFLHVLLGHLDNRDIIMHPAINKLN